MAFDFGTLAGSIGTGLPGVRACLLVSRDGLPLSSHPESAEARAMKAWAQLQNLGDVDKGFIGMTDEMWVFVRRGPFAALVLAEPSARPGVLLTALDQALMAADEERVRSRSDLRSAVREETSPRFRAPLHRDPDRVASGSTATPPAAPPRAPITLPEPGHPLPAVPKATPESRTPEGRPPERSAPDRTPAGRSPAEGMWPRTTPRPPAAPRPAPDRAPAPGRAPTADRSPTPDRAAAAARPAPPERPVRPAATERPPPDRPAAAEPAAAASRTPRPERPRPAARPPGEDASLEVDPVELAREFGGLYAEGEE